MALHTGMNAPMPYFVPPKTHAAACVQDEHNRVDTIKNSGASKWAALLLKERNA